MTEAELRTYVDVSHEDGVIENEEKDEQSKDEEKTETVTYEKKADGVVVNVDLTHDGEELVRQVTTTTASYDDIEAENKEEAKEMFE